MLERGPGVIVVGIHILDEATACFELSNNCSL